MNSPKSNTHQITLYQQAKTVLAEYKTVDEVKDFRDKALAIEAYAKQANDMELEWDAARARVRAERKCGELLAQVEKAKGGQPYQSIETTGRPGYPIHDTQFGKPKTLTEMGITRDQSSNWQKLALVPEEEFERAVDNPAAKPSTTHIIKPKEPEPKRMDQDALWLWGTLRDMRSKNLFERSLADLTAEWTDAMKADASSIIPNLQKWVNKYE